MVVPEGHLYVMTDEAVMVRKHAVQCMDTDVRRVAAVVRFVPTAALEAAKAAMAQAQQRAAGRSTSGRVRDRDAKRKAGVALRG